MGLSLTSWLTKQDPRTAVEASAIYAKLFQLANVRDQLQGLSAAKQIALNILVPQLAALRIGVYDRKTGERVKNFLHDKLNYDLCSTMTGYEFWQTMYYNLIRYNNAFALAVAVGNKVVGVRPIPTLEIVASVQNGTIGYLWNSQPYDESKIWHLRVNTDNGLLGKAYEDEVWAFELAKECEAMAQDYFKQGGNVRRIWKFAGTNLAAKQLADLQAFLDAALKGKLKQQLDVVVPYGLEHEVLDLNLEQAQMLQSRQHQTKEILALYGIDLAALNLETIYNLSIVPLCEMVEQSLTRHILTPDEQSKFKVQYIVASRFRGDTAKQFDIAGKALQFESINEVRDWFGLNPKGTEYDAIINPNTSSAKVNEQRSKSGGA